MFGMLWLITWKAWAYFNTWHFVTRHEDISAQEHFGMGIIWHHGYFGMGILRHWNISEQGYFSKWKYLYCFARCQNVHMPKRPCAETSMCQNLHVPKYLSAKMFNCHNVNGSCPCAKKSPWWNVRAEMYIAKMSGVKISQAIWNTLCTILLFGKALGKLLHLTTAKHQHFSCLNTQWTAKEK